MEAQPLDAAKPAGNGKTPLLIAGVGMSAGGLEAARDLLEALPADPGMALVLIPHLAPHQRSSLPALLAQYSRLPVIEAANAMPVETNRVYVIPPDVVMEMGEGGLRLTPRPPAPEQTHPVDSFLSSLAFAQGERAVGVILSGTGSDGVQGIRTIKQHGGTVIVQQPETAKYDGMPQAAIETGLADLALPPPVIAVKLVEMSQLVRAAPGPAETNLSDEHLQDLTDLLRSTTGVDFSHYKQPTIRRRVLRRMAFHRFADAGEYVAWVRAHREEAKALYQDILIHVTRFFREPDSFEALETLVIPKLLEGRRADSPIRVWVAGCATGEEAYSVAMTLTEATTDAGAEANFQLFGTDVSDTAVDFARQGLYAASVVDDVPPDRLRRFFSKSDGGYRINKSVRDRCVFARQDLTRDPPFSRLDLVVCRNVLIYLDATLQRRVMNVFHYALKPTGFLMLGQAETTGSQAEFFTLVEKKHRIYRKRPVEHVAPAMTLSYQPPRPALRAPAASEAGMDARALQNEANRTLLDRYGPPGVLINDALDIVQFRGHTGPFLEPPPGEASLGLLKLAREGLLHGLRSALQSARKSRKPVRKEGLRVRSNGGWTELDLEVIPLVGLPSLHFLVVFDRPQTGRPAPARRPPAGRAGKSPGQVERLEEELASTREYLQSIIQEVEAANEELQSANEEILSSNEELQSTNEELDTAKEELQSTNEELNTLNEELHARNEELTRVNSDLVNLLGSVQIAIVIVSTDLRIRRFTPMAEKILNLIPADVGRPISQVNPNIDVSDLGGLILKVVDKVEPVEQEVQDAEGRWHMLRIRPYKGLENRIEGAVVALFDIESSKRHAVEVGRQGKVIKVMLESMSEPAAILDETLQVRRANRAFSAQFGPTSEAPGPIYVLGEDGRLAAARAPLEQAVRDRCSVDGFEVPELRGSSRHALVMRARPLELAEFGGTALLVVFGQSIGDRA